jgi:hypothetical protein
MTVEQARKILGKKVEHLNDNEVIELVERFRNLASIVVEKVITNDTIVVNEKSSNPRPSFLN